MNPCKAVLIPPFLFPPDRYAQLLFICATITVNFAHSLVYCATFAAYIFYPHIIFT